MCPILEIVILQISLYLKLGLLGITVLENLVPTLFCASQPPKTVYNRPAVRPIQQELAEVDACLI